MTPVMSEVRAGVWMQVLVGQSAEVIRALPPRMVRILYQLPSAGAMVTVASVSRG